MRLCLIRCTWDGSDGRAPRMALARVNKLMTFMLLLKCVCGDLPPAGLVSQELL
jgi:hypothetical protein